MDSKIYIDPATLDLCYVNFVRSVFKPVLFDPQLFVDRLIVCNISKPCHFSELMPELVVAHVTYTRSIHMSKMN